MAAPPRLETVNPVPAGREVAKAVGLTRRRVVRRATCAGAASNTRFTARRSHKDAPGRARLLALLPLLREQPGSASHSLSKRLEVRG